MIFSTSRLRVRRFTIDDLPAFHRLNSDPEIMRFIRPPKDWENCRLFLEENIRFYEPYPLLGRWALLLRESDEVIGSFAMIPIAGSTMIQLGYSLLPAYQGKGLATEAVFGGIGYAWRVLKLDRLFAIAEAGNEASRRVLEKTGFVLDEAYTEGSRPLLRFYLTPPAMETSRKPGLA